MAHVIALNNSSLTGPQVGAVDATSRLTPPIYLLRATSGQHHAINH